MNISFWRKNRKLKYPLIPIFLGIILLCFIGFDLQCPSWFKRNPDLSLVSPKFDHSELKNWNGRNPLWSPKSGEIFFLGHYEPENWRGLAKVEIGEEPEKILEGEFLNFDLSPDETKAVLVKGTEYTERSLVLYAGEEKTTQPIEISGTYPFDISFSSDGKKIFYTTTNSFCVKSIPDGEEKTILKGISGDFDISPGDSLVIFRDACYNINHSPPQKVSEGQYQAQFHPQKPDWIAYFPFPRPANCSLHIKNLYTGIQDSIDVRPYLDPWFYDPFAWSPDGSKIVFSCGPPTSTGHWSGAELWIINNVDKYIK